MGEINSTIRKFGHPATLVREYDDWMVLLRPQQPTLGALVLAAKSDALEFGNLPQAAYTELGTVTRDIETALKAALSYERINYLMLMMVDPHVHFHVIPRYDGERSAEGVTLPDLGWPRAPDLGNAKTLTAYEISGLSSWLKGFWPA